MCKKSFEILEKFRFERASQFSFSVIVKTVVCDSPSILLLISYIFSVPFISQILFGRSSREADRTAAVASRSPELEARFGLHAESLVPASVVCTVGAGLSLLADRSVNAAHLTVRGWPTAEDQRLDE